MHDSVKTPKRRGLLSRFLGERAANVAMMFSFSAIPLCLSVAMAVDYGRLVQMRAKLAAATDAAALAAAPYRGEAFSLRQDIATRTFQAYVLGDANLASATMAMADVDNGVQITAQATVSNGFSEMLQLSSNTLNAKAEAVIGATGHIEVAFVLDNTGSMAQSNKMPLLKTAMQTFLNRLQAATNARARIKVALVPFTTMVRVDPAQARGFPWMAQPSSDLANWQGCIADRAAPYDVNGAPPTTVTPASLYEAADGAMAIFPAAPATLSSPTPCSIAQIFPMSQNFASFMTAVNAMQPAGNTNLVLAFAMGLEALTQGGPIGGASEPFGGTTTKIMVVLTDGLNTQSRWSTDPTTLDQRTELICQEVKRRGVVVYTVGLMQENTALLTNCAKSPDNHFFTSDPSRIPPLFDLIAQQLIRLRLSV